VAGSLRPSIHVAGAGGIGGGTGEGKKGKYMNNKEKITELYEALPKLDCGRCGYNSCWEYAQAVAEEKAPPSLCVSGGPRVNYRLQKLTGTAPVFRPGGFFPNQGPRGERREGMAGSSRFGPTKKNVFAFGFPGRRLSFREQRYKEIYILKNRIRYLSSQLDRIESEIKKTAGK
jgi:hypothetical protein